LGEHQKIMCDPVKKWRLGQWTLSNVALKTSLGRWSSNGQILMASTYGITKPLRCSLQKCSSCRTDSLGSWGYIYTCTWSFVGC
jgi:hypothetical protein